jgi:hypothetical protein
MNRGCCNECGYKFITILLIIIIDADNGYNRFKPSAYR